MNSLCFFDTNRLLSLLGGTFSSVAHNSQASSKLSKKIHQEIIQKTQSHPCAASRFAAWNIHPYRILSTTSWTADFQWTRLSMESALVWEGLWCSHYFREDILFYSNDTISVPRSVPGLMQPGRGPCQGPCHGQWSRHTMRWVLRSKARQQCRAAREGI